MASKFRNLVHPRKPDIKIELNGSKTTFTTSSLVEGVAHLSVPVDTRFDDISIEFLGNVKTYVDRITNATGMPSFATGSQTFLRLTQPNSDGIFPRDGVLKARSAYRLPFSFVVPEALLPSACQHSVLGDAVRECHLKLPPTLGDKKFGVSSAPDDLVSGVVKIQYGICVTISRDVVRGPEVVRSPISTETIRIRVQPVMPEPPPLFAREDNSGIILQEEISLKQGTLKLAAREPQPLQLGSPGHVEVALRFDPADADATPPQLNRFAAKLRVSTFFASTGRSKLPTDRRPSIYDLTQDLLTRQVRLAPHSVGDMQWTLHRDDAIHTYFTSSLTCPIVLPTNKQFVPTFHSCLVSRTYQLRLELALRGPGTNHNIQLKIPIQIISPNETFNRRASIATSDRDSVVDDDFLVMSNDEHLSDSDQDQSTEANTEEEQLPGYTLLPRGAQRRGRQQGLPAYNASTRFDAISTVFEDGGKVGMFTLNVVTASTSEASLDRKRLVVDQGYELAPSTLVSGSLI